MKGTGRPGCRELRRPWLCPQPTSGPQGQCLSLGEFPVQEVGAEDPRGADLFTKTGRIGKSGREDVVIITLQNL